MYYFHCKRAIQEFSYDISRVEKIQEVEVGASLTIPMPQDYVNYTQLAWIDGDGLERIIYPSKITSRPSQQYCKRYELNTYMIMMNHYYSYVFDYRKI